MPNSKSRISNELMRPASVLITGANKGLGLELTRQLVELPKPPRFIFATCRTPEEANELNDLAERHASIVVMKLDVTDHGGYARVVEHVTSLLNGAGLNLLVNNAGVALRENSELQSVTAARMRLAFETNTLAPLMLSQAFLDLLCTAASQCASRCMSCEKAAIINVTSRKGSIANNAKSATIATAQPGTKVGNFVGGRYPYRISKAALNMVTANLAVSLQPSEVLVVALHPGWVRTATGGPSAPLGVRESVAGLIRTMSGLDDRSTGCFVDYQGEEVRW